MRWIAGLLLCAGLALAFAASEMMRGAGRAAPPAEGVPAAEVAEAAQAALEPVPEEPKERSARARSRPSASGESVYYQYVDGSGRVQFARSLDEVPQEWRAHAGRVSLPVAPPASPGAARGKTDKPTPAVRHHEGTFSAARSAARGPQPDIEIYTLKSCGYCRAAMAYMDRKGIEYTNHDLDEEPEAVDEYLEKTGGKRGVPVIDIGGEIMQGWSEKHFDSLLASMR
jgi:glutaredoxin-like protein NrdH